MTIIVESFANHPALAWAVVGFALIIVEVLAQGGFYLPFAVSGLVMAGAAALGFFPVSILWQGVIFFALGVVLIPVCRNLLLRYSDKTPDINDY